MLGLSLESEFTEVPSLLPCAPQQPTLPLTNDKARGPMQSAPFLGFPSHQ